MTSTTAIDHILFGVAYYDEYMPEDRLGRDIEMMKAAHINTVRIAESTWSTMEPQPGEFDFSHVDRVIDAMEDAGIGVIVGTPTYAVPSWLTMSHPEVLACTHAGRNRYGARQLMDITSPAYLLHAERMIRALVGHVAPRRAVMGFQVDNETKYYDVVSPNVQRAFVRHLRKRFGDDLEAMNRAFGLDYWSNRIDAWEDFPDVAGTINASLAGAFDEFRRSLVSDFIGWEASIVREYAREDQFVTQNYDLEWRGYSYGLQPWADDFRTSEHLDIVGVDIYHPTEDLLTGREIALGGDMARSFGGGRNYLQLETQAQGQTGWLPYPGQLRLQAYSHLASGSESVMYWHWHSIHNSYETYWKGLLSHDLEPNPVYEEAGRFGAEIERIGPRLLHLGKRNRVAIVVDNASLSALSRFSVETGLPDPYPYSEEVSGLLGYNDVLRWVYDALFDLNVECDFLPETATAERLAPYALVVTPALYSVDDSFIEAIRGYVRSGGHVVSTFRSFVADRDVTVWHDRAPHGLTDVFGMSYSLFTRPQHVPLDIHGRDAGEAVSGTQDGHAVPRIEAERFIELLSPEPVDGADVVVGYDHSAWGRYAAVTRHRFGAGAATWIGTMFDSGLLRDLLRDELRDAGVWGWPQELAGTVTVRQGVNGLGERVFYLLNYSDSPKSVALPFSYEGLLDGGMMPEGGVTVIEPWGVVIGVRR